MTRIIWIVGLIAAFFLGGIVQVESSKNSVTESNAKYNAIKIDGVVFDCKKRGKP